MSKSEAIELIGVILTAIGLIISILLVKEGRAFFTRFRNRFISTLRELWSSSPIQVLSFLIIDILFLAILIYWRYISIATGIAVGGSFLLIVLLLISLFENLRSATSEVESKMFKVASSVNRLTEIEKIELGLIKDKWKDFLNVLAGSESLIAIHNLVAMAKPVSINGLTIVAIVPDVLEPAVQNLEGRFKEVEPFLEMVLNKNYKLTIRTTKDYYSIILSN